MTAGPEGSPAKWSFSRILFSVALAAHAISWILPVYGSRSGTTKLIGAEAYAITCGSFTKMDGSLDGFLMPLSPHTNYLVILAAWAFFKSKPSLARGAMIGLVISAGINLVWFFVDTSPTELRFGYYVWLASFPALAGALRLHRPRS